MSNVKKVIGNEKCYITEQTIYCKKSKIKYTKRSIIIIITLIIIIIIIMLIIITITIIIMY